MTIKSKIISGNEAREKMQKGAKIVADAVSSSLGPSGKNVAIAYANERGIYGRIIMHDGVTISKAIDLEDEFENFGAQVIKEAARKTVDSVGDGTTVSTILSYAILSEINTLVAAGYDPMLLRKGIEKATEQMIEEIEKISIPVKTLEQKRQIANISAQDEELGDMIAKVIDDMGEEGLVVVEESTSPSTTVDKQAGFQIDKGWADPNFMTNPDRGEATIESPYILVADGMINNLEPIKGLLEDCAINHRKLVLIAPQFGLVAAGAMISNKANGAISCLLIEAPSFGQNQKNILQDIAIFTKAKFFSEWTGLKLEDATIADLGRCEYIKSTKNDTLIVGGIAEKTEVDMRIAEIRKAIENEEMEFDRDKLKERLARLTSGVAVIRVGGATEIEMKERLERVKDSVAATKAAVRKGIVPGGEVVYLVARQKLIQLDVAQNILYKALYQPFKILLNNASMNDGEWYEKLKNAKKNAGVNVVKQEIVDMVVDGIIDPTLVSIEALKNASSTAIANSSAGFIIIQKDIDKK
jgi:chaperonin GroEL